MNEDYLSNALGVAAQRLLELRLVKTISVPTPSVGTDWTLQVPGGVIWELLSIEGVLTTSAAVANRSPSWRIQDQDGKGIGRYFAGSVVSAGAAGTYTSSAGLGNVSVTSGIQAPLPYPPIVMVPMWKVLVITSLLDVGDQWNGVFVTVREWSEYDIVREMTDIVESFDSLTSRLVR